MSLLRRLLRPLLRPRVVFLAAFLAALSLAAAKAALATFVSANCNYNAPTPSSNMYRDGSVTVALVARYEGYHWGGGCWNDNDVDEGPNEPLQTSSNGGEEHAGCRNRQGAKRGQPVHPIRRTPPYDESERYVRVKMFVPHASHFASTIWSAPLVERW